jgi:hypothetical protein
MKSKTCLKTQKKLSQNVCEMIKSDVCQSGGSIQPEFFNAQDMCERELKLIPSVGNLHFGYGTDPLDIDSFGAFLKFDSGEYAGKFYRLLPQLAIAYAKQHQCKGNDNVCKTSEFNQIKKENIKKAKKLQMEIM